MSGKILDYQEKNSSQIKNYQNKYIPIRKADKNSNCKKTPEKKVV